MKHFKTPLEVLKYHVTGAIERGEGQAIEAVVKQDTDKTVVVFRTFRKKGDVIALFPYEVHNGNLCVSYQHIGQHGAADYSNCIDVTRASTPEEITKLKAELEGLGYNLDVKRRRSYRD